MTAPNPAPKREMIISCDWGTSSFRLRVIGNPVDDPATPTQPAGDRGPAKPTVLATLSTGAGIAETHTSWQKSSPASDRVGFFRAVLEKAVAELEATVAAKKLVRQVGSEPAADALRSTPVIISGMASSSIGMLELPYHSLPFAISGADLKPTILGPTKESPRTLYLLPGVRSDDDVMRGEETQLIGCEAAVRSGSVVKQEGIFVFPGTHSKHITVRHGQAVAFKTFMTGEVFGLLSKHSILAASVTAPGPAASPGPVIAPGSAAPPNPSAPPVPSAQPDDAPREAFFAGVDVAAARGSSLLHNAFLIRTNELFKKYNKEDNYHFLSGLLIGEELKQLPPAAVTLVAASPLKESYAAALASLGFPEVTVIDADEALIKGHCAIFARFGATIAPL